MNTNLLLGVAAIGYGAYTAYARVATPEKLGKLDAMKRQWGERAGTVAHVVAYTVVPAIVGMVLIAKGLIGR
jgi:hypothetical protein